MKTDGVIFVTRGENILIVSLQQKLKFNVFMPYKVLGMELFSKISKGANG